MANADVVIGRITFLRVHEVGTGFGPRSDFLDAECVGKVHSAPEHAFGFQLRVEGPNGDTHRGMLDLLREAYFHDRTVRIEYFIEPGKKNGRIFRVNVGG